MALGLVRRMVEGSVIHCGSGEDSGALGGSLLPASLVKVAVGCRLGSVNGRLYWSVSQHSVSLVSAAPVTERCFQLPRVLVSVC